MSTVEYRAWARYADEHSGDYRAQQVMSVIASMMANTWRGRNAAPVRPADFSPWLGWPDDEPDADPYGDPLMEGMG